MNKGLNFIPTPRFTSKIPILEASNKFARTLKLKYHFRNSKFNFARPKFQKKSDFTPPDKDMPKEILETIEKINSDINNLPVPKEHKNLSDFEVQTLRDLRNNPDIVIKPADKGKSTVILSREAYIKEGERQLSDPKYYEKIPGPIFAETAEEVLDILHDLKNKNFLTPKQFDFLKPPEDPRPRVFYMLPKIHKPLEKWAAPNQPPGRPIVSDCSSETYEIASYIEHFLAPLANKHDSYVRDTDHFLAKKSGVKLTKHSIIAVADVESLYPNIDHESGLAAVREAFAANPNPSRPDEEILKLLEIGLRKNDFNFNGETFLQKSGTSMGRRWAVSYANIFMAKWEREAFAKSYIKPTFYCRYIDDLFFIFDCPIECVHQFFKVINSHHPTINLTVTISPDRGDFLDVTVFKGKLFHEKGILDSRMFFKETDSHQLLHKASFHPKHTFRGILKSQIKRFFKICSHKEDFDEACNIVFKALKKRNYSGSFLRKVKRDTLFEIEEGTNFTRQPDFINNQNGEEIKTRPCISKYGYLECRSCHLIKESSKVKSNFTNFCLKINTPLNCVSENIIYLVTCKECKIQYIGESGRSFRCRMADHTSNIYTNKDTTIGAHFNSGGCLPSDFQATPIFKCPVLATREETETKRKEIEQHFIREFKTYLPYGLNLAVTKQKDSKFIHFSAPYSALCKKASQVIRKHFYDLQSKMPEVFPHYLITGFSRNKNLKDNFVSAKLKPK